MDTSEIEEESSDMDNGNELINIISSKFRLTSPKLILTQQTPPPQTPPLPPMVLTPTFINSTCETTDVGATQLLEPLPSHMVPVEQPANPEVEVPTTTPVAMETTHLQSSCHTNTPTKEAFSTPPTESPTSCHTNTPTKEAFSTPPTESPTVELFSVMMSGFQNTISSILQQQHSMQQESLRQQQDFQKQIHEQMMELIKATKSAASTLPATPPPLPVATRQPSVPIATTSTANAKSADTFSNTRHVASTPPGTGATTANPPAPSRQAGGKQKQSGTKETPVQVHPSPVRGQKPSTTSNNKKLDKKKEPHKQSETPPSMSTTPPPTTASTPSQRTPPQAAHSTKKPFRTNAMILGSSIVRHVKGATIRKYSGQQTKVCCFPGAGYEKVADHAEVELKYCTPSVAILHVGGNDLANKIKPVEIAENLAYLGCELIKRGVKRIAVSGMTPRKNLKDAIAKLNRELISMCRTYDYDYIDNSNIWFRHHLANDQVHLNYDGVEILESNFIDYLSYVEVEE